MINKIVLVGTAILVIGALTTTTQAFAYPLWNQQRFFGNLWGNLCQNYYIASTNPNCGHIKQPPTSPIVQPPIPQQSTTSATSSTSQCYNNICTTTNCVNGACTTTGQPQPGQFASTETCTNGVCTICTNGVCSTTGGTRP